MSSTDPTTQTASPRYNVGESRSEDLIAIVTCMVVLATIVLGLRLWTRFSIQGVSLAADDWTILASWLFSLGFTVNVCTQTRFGLGKHIADLPPTTNFAASLELFYFGEATYYITVSLTKMSILFLYLRLIPSRAYQIVNWTMMAFVALTGICCTIAGIFQCNPIPKAWHTQLEGTCFNQVALFLANAGLNILQDLIIYILPVKTLWQLQLPRKQRVALVIVFVIGAFVCVTGILRLESLTMASVSQDPTWDNYGSAIWSSIESNVGIVCASLAHLKPMIARYAPRLLSITGNTRLPDERSGPTKELSHLEAGVSVGNRSGRHSKPFGILTQIELEETDQSSIVRNTSHPEFKPMSDYSSEHESDPGLQKPTTPLDMSRQTTAIHKTTRVTISYGDRDASDGKDRQGF